MSGTLDINEHSAWMPAGWVFDNALALLVADLKSVDASLADTLLAAKTSVRGYGDLRQLEPARFGLLLDAVERVYAQVELKGKEAFHDPMFFDGFMEQLSQFEALLRGDARVG